MMRRSTGVLVFALLCQLFGLTAQPAQAREPGPHPLSVVQPAIIAPLAVTVKSGARTLKAGVTYRVRMNSKKYVKVQLVRKCRTNEAVCDLRLSIAGKRVATAVDGDDSATVFGLLSVSSTTTLVYRGAQGYGCVDIGGVYRYRGKKLVRLATLAPDVRCEEVRDVALRSAGKGLFTLRVSVANWLYEDETHDSDVTYRYSSGKVALARVVTTEPANTSTTGAAANAYGKYCPGYVDGNTTDVYTQAFTHPTWGAVTFVTCMNRITAAEPVNGGMGTGTGTVAVVGADGGVRWTWSSPSMMYTWALASPGTDASGNIFITYNPGRYDGYVVFRATAGGMTQLADFYHAELLGPGANGLYDIMQYDNDCNPSCAGGTTTSQRYVWNGSSYVKA